MNCFCIVPFTISTRPENICKILPETQSEKCLHNLGPPRRAYISGRSNKMCPGPGITLGLIIQNCHEAIATKKEWFIFQLSIWSSWLAAGYCSHWYLLQCCRDPSWDCDQTPSITWGIRRHHVQEAQAPLTSLIKSCWRQRSLTIPWPNQNCKPWLFLDFFLTKILAVNSMGNQVQPKF